MKKVFTLTVVLTTVLWTMGVAAFVPVASAATLAAGDLIKASGAAVYYYAADGKRYTFPTESTYKSWYSDFTGVKTITDDELSAIDLAGNVVVRAGTKLVKITTVKDVFAVEPKGKLIKVKDEASAKALYGDSWNKMIIDIPDGFWVNYTKKSGELDGTVFPEGQLVKKSGAADIYYVNSDGSWSKVKDTAAFTANKWMDKFVVSTSKSAPSAGAEVAAVVDTNVDTSQSGGAGTGTTTTTTTGALTVSLNAATPAGTNVPTNATAAAANVLFTYVDLKAGSSDVTITGLKVTRSGLSQNAAISSIKLFDGDDQVGTSQSLNSSNQAVFNNLTLKVSANTTKKLVIKATLTASAAYNSNIISLGVAAAGDVTTTATVGGTFPIVGNSMTINTGITIGTATLYNGSLGTRNTTDLTVDSDAKDVRFTQVKITAGSAEGVTVTSVTAIKNGTAAANDVLNIRLVNDTTGKTVGTVASLDASGRAVFSGLAEVLDKGKSVELSVLADMANSGAGRTIAFDLHDGVSYTINVTGNTYGFGISPAYNNFCTSAGTCQTQSINQGYMVGNLSSATAATGYLAIGQTVVPILTYELTVAGEPVNVTQSQITITTGTAELSQITQVTIFDDKDKIVAGPQDATTAAAGSQTLTFTDAFTAPVGTTKYTVKVNLATDMAASDTVYAAVPANSITAKGANSGKTTKVTSSSAAAVPPSTAVTGKTQTIKGPVLAVITAAIPVATTFVNKSQDIDLAYFDLDATAGGEDIKATSIVVTQGGTGTVSEVLNLELWGDIDNTDSDNTVAKLEMTSSTATGAATNTFTLKTPLRVSKSKISRLTLKGDVNGTSGTHQFSIVSDNVTAVGWSTGGTTSKTYSGGGQAHTFTTAGTLTVSASADRASAAQFVAGTTGNSMMSYKFQAAYEKISVTDFYVATEADSGSALTALSAVKIYLDGKLIGATGGYSLNASGVAHVVLDSGVFVAAKSPSYSTLDIQVDLNSKDDLADATTVEIGLGDATGTKTEWGENGAAAAGSYLIVATGQSAGTTITATNIDSAGDGSGNVVASYNHYLYDGVLVVSKNSSSPSGTSTAGSNQEVLRLDLQAVGDDITIDEMEFCVTGTATGVTGTGDVTLKSSDLNTTYITMTQSEFDTYWDDYGGNGLNAGTWRPMDAADGTTVDLENCFSFGRTGATGVSEASGAEDSATKTVDVFDVTLSVKAGTTAIVKLFGDTTGGTTNNTLQATVGQNSTAAAKATTSGLAWRNSSATTVDSALTKNLPVQGGSFTY